MRDDGIVDRKATHGQAQVGNCQQQQVQVETQLLPQTSQDQTKPARHNNLTRRNRTCTGWRFLSWYHPGYHDTLGVPAGHPQYPTTGTTLDVDDEYTSHAHHYYCSNYENLMIIRITIISSKKKMNVLCVCSCLSFLFFCFSCLFSFIFIFVVVILVLPIFLSFLFFPDTKS